MDAPTSIPQEKWRRKGDFSFVSGVCVSPWTGLADTESVSVATAGAELTEQASAAGAAGAWNAVTPVSKARLGIRLVAFNSFRLKILSRLSASQIALEKFALLPLEATYGLLFDLAYTLAGEVKFRTYFFQGHFLTSYSEKHLEDFTLAVVELSQGTVHFFGKTLLVECGVCHWAVVVGKHVKQ